MNHFDNTDSNAVPNRKLEVPNGTIHHQSGSNPT